jgi:hypothetical protein
VSDGGEVEVEVLKTLPCSPWRSVVVVVVTVSVSVTPLATSLVRGKTDLVVVAELMGHSRLDTTRQYSLPTEQDKTDALNPPHD